MNMNPKSILLIAAITLGAAASCLTVTGCERKPKTLGERIEDGLDSRPNEKLKDAGEDVRDAVKDAGEGVKDAVKDSN